MSRALRVGLASGVLVLAACGSAPPRAPTPRLDPEAAATRVAAVRAVGGAKDDELDVQPLRNPVVEGLRAQAVAAERAGHVDEAAKALDAAIAQHPDDPALLQERAEIALLAGDLDAAARFAREGIAKGAQLGPLCRRHWATLEQVARARLASTVDATAQPALRTEADQAHRAIEACTVSAPARY